MMKRTNKERILAAVLALVLLVGNVPTAFAAQTGLCDHHTAHEGCGYAEAVPGTDCTHEHGPECQTEETLCVHTHADCGYSEVPEENGCTHSCSAESGCVTQELQCQHIHDELCGYSEGTEGTPCGYECRVCHLQELIDALPDEVTGDNRADVEAQLTAIDEKRLELTDEELALVDFTKYQAAIAGINALDGMAGAEEPDAVPADTSGTLGDNITWSLDLSTGHLSLTGSGAMNDLAGSGNQPWRSYYMDIKSVSVGSGITSVGNHMFAYLYELTSVSLPEGTTTIGLSSFDGCKKLSAISFPSTVTVVGYRAFYECEALTAAHFSSGLTGISEEAFAWCTSLSGVTIPGTAGVSQNAFRGCSSLKTAGPIGGGYDIEFGWTTSIPAYAFYGASSLEEVTFPDTLTRIGDRSFMNAGLKSVTIPDGVTYVGTYAFYSCDLTKVTIPASVTTFDLPLGDNESLTSAGPIGSGCDIEFGWTDKIPDDAFEFCANLTTVTLPTTITSIGVHAFSRCSGLKSITIPASVTAIDRSAFYETGLTSIHFQGSAPTFGTDVFKNVTAVATYPADDATWTDSVRQNYGGTITWVGLGGADGLSGQCGDNVYWTIDTATGTMNVFGTGPMWDYDSDKEPSWGIYKERKDQITTLNFSEGITKIGETTFYGFDGITSLTIPDSVTQVDEYAFSDCGSLTDLDLGDGCSLGEGSFMYCPIKNLELGGSGSFGLQCFTSSYITSITITANSPSFQEGAFWNCTGLKEVHFKGSAPKQVTDKGFVSSLASFRDVTWYYTCGMSGWTTSSRYDAEAKTWAGYTLVSEGHSYTATQVGATCTEAGYTLYTCACGDSYTEAGAAAQGHTWGEWVTQEATCTADGSKTRTCAGCGETETETIPSQGHTEIASTDIDPTCIEEGRIGGSWCDVCGEVFREEVTLPATGIHTFVDGSCTVCGIVGGKCGDELYWTVEDTVLTIYGTGPMYDFEARKAPWQNKYPKSVVIEPGVTVIGTYAFASSDWFKEITLPDTVTTIREHAFYNSYNLKTLVLPDSLETIERFAFWDCGVETLHLGPKVKNVDAWTFFETGKLTGYTVDPANPLYTEVDGILMSKDKTTLIAYPEGRRDTSFTVPDYVTDLGERALANGYLVSVTLSPGITYLSDNLFSGCGRLETVDLPAGLQKIGDDVFDYCDKLTEITIPAGVVGIGHSSFSDCDSLTKITFLGNAPSFNVYAFSGATLDVYYPGQDATWTEDKLQSYGGTINWIPIYDELRADLDPDVFGSTVYIDGEPHSVIRDDSGCYVELPYEEVSLLVTYTFHVGDGSDVHTQYPTGMKVYRVTDNGTGKTAEQITEFDDLLQYSGSSIRITGNKGIRMITSMERSKKDALTGQGLAGYTLVEYGTVLCWSSDLAGGGALTLDKPYARSNYAYKKGVADPVFAYSGSLIQYTNVLVGFTNDQCKDDIAMRSYITLEDGDGNRVTLYGGTVYRSIGYIAYQNRAAFAPGTSAYDYVWEIIHHVYGDQYDAEYEG